jgi:hypothetical protein
MWRYGASLQKKKKWLFMFEQSRVASVIKPVYSRNKNRKNGLNHVNILRCQLKLSNNMFVEGEHSLSILRSKHGNNAKLFVS